jgi:hypothetical protein
MGLLKELKSAGKQLSALSGNTFAKGDLFEVLVQRMLPDKEFAIVHATTRRDDLDGRKIESAKDPDFRVRHRNSNHLFWVECKYRSEPYQDKVQWCEKHQLERYKEFQEKVGREKVYIVIGLGGIASRPTSIYCVPLDEIKYPGLFLTTLQPYKHPRNHPFSYVNGRLK